jgi:predicted transcriptional regulator
LKDYKEVIREKRIELGLSQYKLAKSVGIAQSFMNEIESDYDGVVTDILVDNEQMVEYGQPMFVIKPV